MTRDAHGLHGAQRLARFGEQVPHDERRVAEHVIEHAAALQYTVPEPGRMRTAVLLRGASEIRPARGRHAARPQQLLPRLDVRREKLVLEIPGRNANALRE